MLSHQGAAIFVLRDFHDALREGDVRRRLRDLYTSCLDTGKFIVIVSPVAYVPDELSRDLVLVDLPLPDIEEMRRIVGLEGKALAEQGIAVDTDPGTVAQLSAALLGLTLNEVRHALRRALAAAPKLDGSSVPYLLEEKHLLVKKKTGVIEYIADPGGLENVGGAPVLKKWLVERRRLFEMRDELSRDIVPKGLLLMGISGCGKSLAIKAIAKSFSLPLRRINMIGVLRASWELEGVFFGACRTMEEMAPAVMVRRDRDGRVGARHRRRRRRGRIFAFFLTGCGKTRPVRRRDREPHDLLPAR